MRIRNNTPATRSYRSYRVNVGALNRNLEKLSSGYRINRSADDAAGLAISEKMRAQITGLEGAQRNAKQGIGLIQTTEGALQEYHSMLNRMLELSMEAANPTFDDAVDRQQLQKEMLSLSEELNRIADSTNFNGIYTLNGSIGDEAAEGEIDGEAEAVTLMDERLRNAGGQSGQVQFTLLWDSQVDLDLHCYAPDGSHIYYGNRSAGGGNLDVDAQAGWKVDDPVENIYFSGRAPGEYNLVVHNYSSMDAVGEAYVRVRVGNDTRIYRLNDLQPKQYQPVTKFTVTATSSGIGSNDKPDDYAQLLTESGDNSKSETKIATGYVYLIIGETGEQHNVLKAPIFNMHTNTMNLSNLDISTQDGALDALDRVRKAVDLVSDVRGTYGAIQNRLEHTINYLGNAQENIQYAESVIRDADMADEIMKYTKNGILVQSAQSMLAQANMQPEGILRLLQ